jgi:hypothetical protein
VRRDTSTTLLFLLIAFGAFAQSQPPQPPPPEAPPHDITQVDPAPLGGAIAVPLPEAQRKRLRKYEIPELAGSRQALGTQLIDGALPSPILDYIAVNANVQQRLSIFQGGLVVVSVTGAGGTIHKKVIIPKDALGNYTKTISSTALGNVRQGDLSAARDGRRVTLRVYSAPTTVVERTFDPMAAMPKALADQVTPMQDLLRAICEDREVTNTVAGYMPQVGDELVGDDRKVYRVARVIDGHIVELRCTSQPTSLYVDVKSLYNYFVGTTGAARQ